MARPLGINHVALDAEKAALTGVCLMELRQGLIARNQVFFDRSPLLDASGSSEQSRTTRRTVTTILD